MRLLRKLTSRAQDSFSYRRFSRFFPLSLFHSSLFRFLFSANFRQISFLFFNFYFFVDRTSTSGLFVESIHFRGSLIRADQCRFFCIFREEILGDFEQFSLWYLTHETCVQQQRMLYRLAVCYFIYFAHVVSRRF